LPILRDEHHPVWSSLLGLGRSASASLRASTVSDNRTQRRGMSVFGRG
jgi:hypothetical protein